MVGQWRMQEENLFVPGCRGDVNSLISQLKTVDRCSLPWFPNVQKSKTVPAQTQRPYRSPPESSFPGRLMLFSTLCNTLALGPAASADSDATDSDATVTTA